jgi:hypothetical protein
MSIDINSPESRKALAKMMIKLFDHWEIEAEDRLELLGLDADDPSILDQFRSGKEPLPETGDTMVRVSWLLTVHKMLDLLYQYNEDIRYSWVNRRNNAFDSQTPLYVMRVQGLAGIKRIAAYLGSI